MNQRYWRTKVRRELGKKLGTVQVPYPVFELGARSNAGRFRRSATAKPTGKSLWRALSFFSQAALTFSQEGKGPCNLLDFNVI
jgi:hypothetical protein